MEKGCGWEDSGHPGAEEANAPQRALRTWDSTSSVRGCAGRQLAAAELVPPCLILGGVEQPKRRRRALNRGGEKKASCQLQNLKPRGASELPSAGEESVGL